MIEADEILAKVGDKFLDHINFIKEGYADEWAYILEENIGKPMSKEFIEYLTELQKETSFTYTLTTTYTIDEEIITIEILHIGDL